MEFIIAKNYWNETNEEGKEASVVNVLKYDRMEWGYLHGVNDEPLIPIFIHIDTIYCETKSDRDLEFRNMKKDGYIPLKDFEPPAFTHNHMQDVVRGEN